MRGIIVLLVAIFLWMIYYSFHNVHSNNQESKATTQNNTSSNVTQTFDDTEQNQFQGNNQQFKSSDENESLNTANIVHPIYDVYWAYSLGGDNGNIGGIYGANIDSLDIPTKVININTSIESIATDKNGNIYWADSLRDGIYKADKNGNNIQEIVSDLSHPMGIAIDSKRNRIYWADSQQDIKKGFIGYSNLDGKDKKLIVTDKLKSGGGLYYDEQHDKLYISDLFGGKIMRLDLINNDLSILAYAGQPDGLTVDYKNRRIVWADIEDDCIASVGFDGSDKRVLVQFESGFANPSAVTINKANNRIIYAMSKDSIGQIGSSNLDGGNSKIVYSSFHPSAQALFGTK